MTGEKLVESVAINDGDDLEEPERAHESGILACCDGQLATGLKSGAMHGDMAQSRHFLNRMERTLKGLKRTPPTVISPFGRNDRDLVSMPNTLGVNYL